MEKGWYKKLFLCQTKQDINLTIAKYLTPKGKDINKKGITPDIEVQFTQKDINAKKDIQLETAKNILNQMIAQNKD